MDDLAITLLGLIIFCGILYIGQLLADYFDWE